jgi:CubicO group peptidase (beta-lactamase class C family)
MSGHEIHGSVAPGFEPVRDAFAANFALEEAYREVGASLAVYRHGIEVVDLWGGHADRAGTRPWRRDTLVNLWSTTKAVAAMCVALLVERKRLRYADKVADCWPQFAAAGKRDVTVAHVLSHQAGLPGFAEPTSIEDLFDQDLCAARLAAQAPLWEPGTANGYHAVTYGTLVAEIVRRVDGRTIGRFLAEELAGPRRADFHIGLPAALDGAVADTIPPDRPADLSGLEMNPAMVMALSSPSMDPARANRSDWRAAELPALNGHGSAQAIATLYSALIGGDLLSEPVLDSMTKVAADRPDLVIGFNPQWGMGIARNGNGMFGPEPDAFGHSGWGGSFGCAHRPSGIAIGYALNHMGPELVGDPRATGLCRAIFGCLEDAGP